MANGNPGAAAPRTEETRQTTLAGLAAATAALERPRVYSEDFRAWYADYPRKRNPADAWKAWQAVAKTRPPLGALRAALAWQKRTEDWTKDAGKWIPYPASYLRAGAFDDEPPARALYCPFHRTIRNNGYPAPRPVDGCPECKHVAARMGTRKAEPEAVAQLVKRDEELRRDWERLFPGEPYPGFEEAFRKVTRQIRQDEKRAPGRQPGEDE